jgi:hypothetical protein
LCGSGILYNTTVSDTTYTFGSSGFLFRSNKLMYDTQTQSLWHSLTGEPVVGPLTHSGIKLAVLPVVITTWEDWVRTHPTTVVLDINTGFDRDYTPGKPYGDYFASPDTMFPVSPRDTRLPPKTYVFALRRDNQAKAYPLKLLSQMRVVNDRFAGIPVTLIANAKTRTARAYERRTYRFKPGKTAQELIETTSGDLWHVQAKGLVHSDRGENLPPLGGHISYWFGWYAFYPHTEVYTGPESP